MSPPPILIFNYISLKKQKYCKSKSKNQLFTLFIYRHLYSARHHSNQEPFFLLVQRKSCNFEMWSFDVTVQISTYLLRCKHLGRCLKYMDRPKSKAWWKTQKQRQERNWEARGKEGKIKGLYYENSQCTGSYNKPWPPQYFFPVIVCDWFMEHSSINQAWSTGSQFMLRTPVNILEQGFLSGS